MTDHLAEKLEKVKTRSDLSEFIGQLCNDLNANGKDWENPDLPSFLDSMAAWVESMDGYYKNSGKPFSEDQPWKLFAEILYAAKIYE